ncbi:MAG: GAF domain-containing protein, partial [Chloroflexota bacterium]
QTRATFQVGDRWVEGTAMQIPANDELRTVVTLRELTGNGNGNGSHGHHMAEGKLDVSASMGIIGEIGETVNASLSVDQVLQSILAIISKYVDVDAGEITLWDEKNRMLEQRGWLGDAGYVVDLATYGGAYQMGEGVSGWVARHQQPLLIPDIDAPDAVKPKLETNPYRSFVAIPLQLGEQFIGTLELVHKTAGHFQQSHLALLQSIARPVTMAIFNASLYTSQINRINDIANLQKVTRDVEENDTATVYQTLNARIAELTDAAVCGVLLYDDSRKRVIGQPPFHGLPDGLVRAISIPVDTEDAGYDIWQNRDYWVANDLSENTVADEIGISSVVVAAGLQNMVLMVMQIGRQRMGMLMVANKRGLAGFTNQDLQNLQILVAQAAIVVENARLFQREMRHDTELVGLQEITHAIGALSNEDEVYVYSDINTRIAGLMSIQMCGVLLYDEVQNYLVAQPPFYGIGEDIIGDYAIDLSQNDVLMELWEESDFWYTNRAMADTVVFSAGMAEMAELAGVEKTLFASLTAGGRKIGVIEVSNKLDGSDFNDNDARLLMIFATQAAAIIENARLVQEVQRRADEANRLRVIAERAGNLVTMQETLAPVLSEVARLTESQLTYLSTIEPGGALVTHPRAVFGAELDSPLRFDVGTDGFEELVSSLQQPLILNDAGESSPYYRAIKQMHIQRMVIVPLFIGERSLGELIIANRERPYTNLDVDMLTGVAAQFASTIDRVRLFEEAEENLNRRV